MAIDFEDLQEIILSQAKTVLRISWNDASDNPSGAHVIKRWKGLYFVCSAELDDEGPFESLEEAWNLERLNTFTPYPKLWSRVLGQATLKNIARKMVATEKDEILINTKRFILRGGKLCLNHPTVASPKERQNCSDRRNPK